MLHCYSFSSWKDGPPHISLLLRWVSTQEEKGREMTQCLTECKALVTPSTRNGHRVFSYTLESHTAAAFSIMNELRLERQLCDVTLRVRYKDLDTVDFVAHKVVLASSSPVFRAMFTNGLKECGMEVVPIEGIHPKVRRPCYKLKEIVLPVNAVYHLLDKF